MSNSFDAIKINPDFNGAEESQVRRKRSLLTNSLFTGFGLLAVGISLYAGVIVHYIKNNPVSEEAMVAISSQIPAAIKAGYDTIAVTTYPLAGAKGKTFFCSINPDTRSCTLVTPTALSSSFLSGLLNLPEIKSQEIKADRYLKPYSKDPFAKAIQARKAIEGSPYWELAYVGDNDGNPIKYAPNYKSIRTHRAKVHSSQKNTLAR